MKTIIEYFTYSLFKLLVGIFKLLPLKAIYRIVPLLSFLMRKIFKYRIKTVRQNLTSVKFSLDQNTLHIEKKFYGQLTTHLLEAIKGFSMPIYELQQRYVLTNPEILNEYFEQKKSVLLIGSHMFNWEWGILALGGQISHQICGIYQYISNRFIHQYLMKLRSRGGMHLISYNQAIRQIVQKQGVNAFMILADQAVPEPSKGIWTKFLGKATPFVYSLEALRAKTSMPMFYFEIISLQSGRYRVTLHPLSLQPQDEKPGDITKRYAAMLENSLNQYPHAWLWSHKRWKKVHSHSIPIELQEIE